MDLLLPGSFGSFQVRSSFSTTAFGLKASKRTCMAHKPKMKINNQLAKRHGSLHLQEGCRRSSDLATRCNCNMANKETYMYKRVTYLQSNQVTTTCFAISWSAQAPFRRPPRMKQDPRAIQHHSVADTNKLLHAKGQSSCCLPCA